MNKTIDATGLKCPLPVLKTQKLLRGMVPGECVIVTATDPNAPSDMEDLCRATSNELIKSEKNGDGVFEFVIQKR